MTLSESHKSKHKSTYKFNKVLYTGTATKCYGKVVIFKACNDLFCAKK